MIAPARPGLQVGPWEWSILRTSPAQPCMQRTNPCRRKRSSPSSTVLALRTLILALGCSSLANPHQGPPSTPGAFLVDIVFVNTLCRPEWLGCCVCRGSVTTPQSNLFLCFHGRSPTAPTQADQVPASARWVGVGASPHTIRPKQPALLGTPPNQPFSAPPCTSGCWSPVEA